MVQLVRRATAAQRKSGATRREDGAGQGRQGQGARPLAGRGRVRQGRATRARGADASDCVRRGPGRVPAVGAKRSGEDQHHRAGRIGNAEVDLRLHAAGEPRPVAHVEASPGLPVRNGAAGEAWRGGRGLGGKAERAARHRRRRRSRAGARRRARAAAGERGAGRGEIRLHGRHRARVRVGHRLRPLGSGRAPRRDPVEVPEGRARVVVQLPARPRRRAAGRGGRGRAQARGQGARPGGRRGAARERRAARPLGGPQPVRLSAAHRRARAGLRRGGESRGAAGGARDRRAR